MWWDQVIWGLGLSLKCAFAPTGRRWAPDEEDGAEQQPHRSAGCHREGGGPQHPAAGSGGLVLHRRRHHREDRLVGVACEGW